MKSGSTNKRYFVWLPLWIAFGIAVGIFIGNRFSFFGSKQAYFSGANKLDAILDYINEGYVDTINTQELIESTIPQLIAGLDPHTTYISAKDMELMGDDLEGHFSGIGVIFSLRNDTVVVMNVVPEGPSQAAGIRPGDRIVYVNDSLFAGKGITNEKVMRNLRGKAGTDLKLGIKRFDSPKIIDIKVTRGDIPVNTVDASFSPAEKIGFIKISKFGGTTHEEFVTAISKLKKQNQCNSFIIDLRENTGGYLKAAIDMVNEFLDEGQLIVYTEGRAFPRETVMATGSGIAKKDQLVILIDEGSASASEVFSGAIQDNDRGLIIGRRSFGKGLVQSRKVFQDGSALQMTIARYYSPSGRCIQKPYELGKSDDYYQDIYNRFEHGEFYSQDSIKQSDATLFYTVGGRPVHGSGGIAPDIFMPRDTTGINSYYITMAREGLLFEYASRFTDSNRARLASFKTWQELNAFLDRQPLVSSLVILAESKGVRNRTFLVNECRTLLETQIKGYIIRNMFDDSAYYQVVLKDDVLLKKAIELLQQNKAYPGAVINTKAVSMNKNRDKKMLFLLNPENILV